MTPTGDRHIESRVDLDAVFHALAHTHRRRILLALLEATPRDQRRFEFLESLLPDAERAAVSFHHHHLPRLHGAGLIDWDRQSGMIAAGATFEEIRPVLELLDGHAEDLPGEWP